MSNVVLLLEQVILLCSVGQEIQEESFRITVTGSSLNSNQAAAIRSIFAHCKTLQCPTPTLILDGVACPLDELEDGEGLPWRFVFGKSSVAELLKARDEEQTILFCSVEGMCAWANNLIPFARVSEREPDFNRPVTIRVHGLANGFGGNSLWVLPIEGVPSPAAEIGIPSDGAVHKIVRLISPQQGMRVNPLGWALSWGALDSENARPWLRHSCLVLGSCLVEEVRNLGSAINVTLKGAKSHSLALWNSNAELPWKILHQQLVEAVEWVYEERSETRLKLLMDRLAVDINPAECLLVSLLGHLRVALKRAKDSYEFVIFERKDNYYKEVRDLMKDIKSQADLYSSKVRDVVSNLTRDILGILVLLGFSFVAKFDLKNLQALLVSNELSLLLKFISFYLILSGSLQLASHWRDASLAYAESKNWLSVLRNYTSQKDAENSFMGPINRRRETFRVAMAMAAGLYAAFALIVWNLDFIIKLLLVQ